ncbi:MAG TPA: MlaD family protein [Dissulfurispiraceae bacterium]|nr:MlaD family protein [Dissulfurispiraceae bacterium]
MSKQPNKTLIGIFVIGAITLIVAGLVVFGSGKFFKKVNRYVMFFDGSAKGLNVGAPVVFRGVKIGTVTAVNLIFLQDKKEFLVRVFAETDPEAIQVIGDSVKIRMQELPELIEKGLRAQLTLQSFVTGLLMVSVDIFPDKPATLYGLDKSRPEVPTIPTDLERLRKTLEEIPWQEIAKKVESIASGVDKLVNSPELQASIKSLDGALKSADKLAQNVDSQVKPLSSSVQETLRSARSALAQAERTLTFKEGATGEMAESLKETLASARASLEAVRKAAETAQKTVKHGDGVMYQINDTLQEISALAQSLQNLTDLLERNPDVLIRGKKETEGVKK